MTDILIAEDEQRIARFIAKGLTALGFQTETVGSGTLAVAYATSGAFDLMILDINLPEVDGFTALRRIRAAGAELPIIILTSRNEVDDTLAGLEGGADDYMPKPFVFEELVARIRLRLRSRHSDPAPTELVCGDVRLSLLSRTCVVEGRHVDLSTREFDLLRTFLTHPGQVLPRELLLSRVWGLDFDPESNVVDVYVSYLRKKLGSHRLSTVRGVGFRWESPAHP